MPNFPPHECQYPACRILVYGRGAYCEAHATQTRAEQGRARKNIKFYDSADWRNTSQAVRRYNPICQRINDGRQCTRPAAIVHHIEDPSDRPDLRLAWDNLVAVCPQCHPGGQPGAAPDEQYVATLGPYGAVYYHKNKTLPNWYAPTPAP